MKIDEVNSEPVLATGYLSKRLGFSVRPEFLVELGFKPAAKLGYITYWRVSEIQAMRLAISERLMSDYARQEAACPIA